jgi:molecular chaperone DnaK
MEQGGTDRIKAATETLTKASHKLAEVMYSQQGSAGDAGAGASQAGDAGGNGKSADDVIEAEVVDENK